MEKTYRVAVIGGGITGLTAARRLMQQADHLQMQTEITIYEAANRLGGKVLTYRDGGLTLEAGPDSMLARKPTGMRLLQELGLASEIVYTNSAASQTYIARNAELVPMPSGTFIGIPMNVSAFLQTDLLSSQGKLRALFDICLPGSKLEEDVSLGAYLRARLGHEWVEQLGEPLLAGIYAGRVDDLSLQATWQQIVQLGTEYRSLIVGARAMRKRQSTPSNNSGRSAFMTVRGGLETVIERLADVLADKVHIALGHQVTRVAPTVRGYTLVIKSAGEVEEKAFDAVIVCTPVDTMKRLLQTYLPRRANPFDVPYVSTATVILGYPKSHVKVDLSKASGFLVPRSENRAITASTWTSSKWPHTTTEDYVVLRCYVGRAGQASHLALADHEMVRAVHQDVKDLVGISPSPVFSKVTRWDNSMPNYLVGHLTRLQQLKQDLVESLPGVFVAGGGYEGLGLPDCIVQGESAAEAVWAHLLQHHGDRQEVMS